MGLAISKASPLLVYRVPYRQGQEIRHVGLGADVQRSRVVSFRPWVRGRSHLHALFLRAICHKKHADFRSDMY